MSKTITRFIELAIRETEKNRTTENRYTLLDEMKLSIRNSRSIFSRFLGEQRSRKSKSLIVGD